MATWIWSSGSTMTGSAKKSLKRSRSSSSRLTVTRSISGRAASASGGAASASVASRRSAKGAFIVASQRHRRRSRITQRPEVVDQIVSEAYGRGESVGRFDDMYRRSLDKPEAFWADAARAIDWDEPWERVLDD